MHWLHTSGPKVCSHWQPQLGVLNHNAERETTCGRACSAGKTATVRELVERGHASLNVKDKQVGPQKPVRLPDVRAQGGLWCAQLSECITCGLDP